MMFYLTEYKVQVREIIYKRQNIEYALCGSEIKTNSSAHCNVFYHTRIESGPTKHPLHLLKVFKFDFYPFCFSNLQVVNITRIIRYPTTNFI